MTTQANKLRTKRPKAKSFRKRFLHADVTEAEQEEIHQYCRKRGISFSQFMTELMLDDALKSKARTKQKEKVTLRPELELTPQQQDKLELLARLHQKKSVAEYILDVLEPELELRRLHAPAKTKMLRYYVSDEEYKLLSKHLHQSGVAPSNYAALLALRTIRKDRRKLSK